MIAHTVCLHTWQSLADCTAEEMYVKHATKMPGWQTHSFYMTCQLGGIWCHAKTAYAYLRSNWCIYKEVNTYLLQTWNVVWQDHCIKHAHKYKTIDISWEGKFMHRFICLVKVHNNLLNYNTDNSINFLVVSL